MDKIELKERTKQLALGVIKMTKDLPNSQEYWIISKQVIRSATSVGANYRSTLRAKSKKDFIAKISIVIEEVDESYYWLEILEELIDDNKVLSKIKNLKQEANELTAIFVTTKKTAINNL